MLVCEKIPIRHTAKHLVGLGLLNLGYDYMPISWVRFSILLPNCGDIKTHAIE